MTRGDLLHLLIGQAKRHGFAFRKWYVEHTGMAWVSYGDALQWLAIGRRAHMLLFSHGFAQSFFQSGEKILYVVPPQSYERISSDGSTLTVRRRAHLRHSSREDVWRFHLREMATHSEPLRYIRRFLLTEETLAATEDMGRHAAENYDDENLVRDVG